jgi:TetR/AcrR family transcriptional regulator, transcriptional repressor of bet genes
LRNSCCATCDPCGDSLGSVPRQVDHEQRRAELVAALWTVIAARGIEAVTLRVIAAEAGCTTGRISHYFGDRQELLEVALQEVHNAAKRRMIALPVEQDPRRLLRSVLMEALPLDPNRLLEWKVWVAFWGIAATAPRLADFNAQRYDEWRAALRPLLQTLVGKRRAEQELRGLVALVDGLGMQLTIGTAQAKDVPAVLDFHLARVVA